MPNRLVFLLALALLGCDDATDTDTVVDNVTPVCDGIQQEGEVTVDAPFDVDGDGFFDADNPDCAATFTPSQLDCDDADPDVNPTQFEIPCNGVDDDCREASPENPDSDGDGVGACDDCNDQNPLAFPGGEETCFDDADNDCDGTIDNDCGDDYSGDWIVLDPVPELTCGLNALPPLPAVNIVDMVFDDFFILYNPPLMTVGQLGGVDPTAIEGDAGVDGVVSITAQEGVVGDCIKVWTFEGVFTDENNFTGTLTLDLDGGFLGGLVCGNCPLMPQSFPVTAARISN